MTHCRPVGLDSDVTATMAVGKTSTTALVVVLLASCIKWALGTEETTLDGYRIPPLLSPWDAYPNVLNITNEDRRRYHPVLKFPKIWIDEDDDEEEEDSSSEGKKRKRRRRRRRRVDNYSIMDLRNLTKEDGLATPEEWLQSVKEGRRVRIGQETSDNVAAAAAVGYKMDGYSVGRYDENRAHLYGSEMFEDGSHCIDGYSGEDRTIHMGMDLQGPLGTKIHAFWSGRVHKAGYNPDLGDYGNVLVLEHDLGKGRTVWALYGHLDQPSVTNLKEGQRIRRGQALGCVGDLHENGGW